MNFLVVARGRNEDEEEFRELRQSVVITRREILIERCVCLSNILKRLFMPLPSRAFCLSVDFFLSPVSPSVCTPLEFSVHSRSSWLLFCFRSFFTLQHLHASLLPRFSLLSLSLTHTHTHTHTHTFSLSL